MGSVGVGAQQWQQPMVRTMLYLTKKILADFYYHIGAIRCGHQKKNQFRAKQHGAMASLEGNGNFICLMTGSTDGTFYLYLWILIKKIQLEQKTLVAWKKLYLVMFVI